MLFESRVLHVAKDLGFAEEYEDAYCVSDERGVAAIADGVSSAVFSGKWSRIVTEALTHRTPDLHDAEAFRAWLKEIRAVWFSQIDFPRLPPNLQAKLRQVGGAFCTLLWVVLDPPADPADGSFRAHAFALGDTSLFHLRDGVVQASFPMSCSADFNADPMSLCSVDWSRDQQLEFKTLEFDCKSGDLLVLATDAVAKWALETYESGGQIDWPSYAFVDAAAWAAGIEALRADQLIRRDDSTLILLSVGQAFAQSEAPHPDPATSSDEQAGDAPATADDLARVPDCESDIVPNTAVAVDVQPQSDFPDAAPLAN